MRISAGVLPLLLSSLSLVLASALSDAALFRPFRAGLRPGEPGRTPTLVLDGHRIETRGTEGLPLPPAGPDELWEVTVESKGIPAAAGRIEIRLDGRLLSSFAPPSGAGLSGSRAWVAPPPLDGDGERRIEAAAPEGVSLHRIGIRNAFPLLAPRRRGIYLAWVRDGSAWPRTLRRLLAPGPWLAGAAFALLALLHALAARRLEAGGWIPPGAPFAGFPRVALAWPMLLSAGALAAAARGPHRIRATSEILLLTALLLPPLALCALSLLARAVRFRRERRLARLAAALRSLHSLPGFLRAHLGSPEGQASGLGRIPAFLLLAAAAGLSFLPALRGYYLYHDDTFVWAWNRAGWETHPTYAACVAYGRPLANWVLCPLESIIHRVEDANLARGIVLLGVALWATLLHRWLRLHGQGRLEALLLAGMAALLPSFQVAVGYLANAPQVAAGILALGAALLFHPVASGRCGDAAHRLLLAAAAAGLLLGALSCYQPPALSYWSLLAVPLLRPPSPDPAAAARSLRRFAALGLLCMGAYFVAYRFLSPAWQALMATEPDRVAEAEPAKKLLFFCYGILPPSANLWSIEMLSPVTFGVLALAFAAPFLGGPASASLAGRLVAGGRKLLLLCLLLPLSFTANLVAGKYDAPYRSLLAPTLILLFAAWESVSRLLALLPWRGARPGAAAGLLLCAGIIAHRNLSTYLVDPCSHEHRFLLGEISRMDPARTQGIHVVRPDIVGVTDEFGLASTYAPQDVRNLVIWALRERGVDPARLEITNGSRYDPLPSGKGILVVDMNRMLESGLWSAWQPHDRR